MLTVPTYLDRSVMHGIGLFSKNVIGAGQTVWEFSPLIDLKFSLAEWHELRRNLSPHSFCNLVNYSYKEKGCLFICLDNAQFMNHSQQEPNVIQDLDQDRMYSAREIAPGEELFCDYFAYSDSDDIHVRNLLGTPTC